jgi:hypothetical protein
MDITCLIVKFFISYFGRINIYLKILEYIFYFMGKKIVGMEIELKMVKNLFKRGGFGFRAPGSGTYTLPHKSIPYNDLQKKCRIDIEGVAHLDFGYETDYITCDYAGFFPVDDVVRNVTAVGIFGSKEFRLVEAKTVRLRKSHLKKSEKNVDRKKINKKTRKMKETFNILQRDKRSWVRRPDSENPKKNVKVDNPYFDKLRKSDFCMELQRTWYFAEVIKKLDILKCQVYAYLQLRFVSSNKEIWIRINDLVKWQDYEMNKARDKTCTMLDIIKDDKNEITWQWRRNNSYKFD